MNDSNNPETIEIHGYSTIHKLCRFAADREMEGCTFTDIVVRALNEIDSLKAQLAKVESGEYVIVPKKPTEKMMHSALMTVIHNNGDVKAMYKMMIEAAQENSHE